MESDLVEEAQHHESPNKRESKRGGWITFPFIIGNLAGISVAAGGFGANWIVFLITKFNVGSITATKINNVGFGFINLFPVAGAIIADSFAGNFIVVAVSSFIALLGMVMATLIGGIDSLRPAPCFVTSTTSCESPTKLQYLFLYAAMGLTAIGVGGSRFTVATMGADQFDKTSGQQTTFFNWYFVVLYVGNAISFLGIVYIEDNVGWALGFGICVLAIVIGFVMFLIGKPFYRFVKPEGSPFTSMVRVVVAAIRKRNVSSEDYYCGEYRTTKIVQNSPTKSFRFFNRAAMKTEEDKRSDGTYSPRSWKLCTVQEVEDLKTVMKILPLWSSTVLLSTTIAILNSMTTVQALKMDRSLGSTKVSAGTFLVFNLMSTAASIFLIDRFFLPAWRRLFRGRAMTLLQRIGLGHVINFSAMAGSALIESQRRRLRLDQSYNMSAFWLVVTLAVAGVGEGFQFPGQIELYYREFPESMRSTSTAMISLLIGVGYYLSAVLMELVDRSTGWLPDDIDKGRLDNVYWLCSVIGALNFGYFLLCAWFYEYRADRNSHDDGDE